MELPFDPVIPLLGLYPQNPETPIQKNLCTPMVTAAQFTIAKCWKQPKCPSVDEQIKKLQYFYTVEYYPAQIKKMEFLLFVTGCVDLESIMLNEKRQVSFDFIHVKSNDQNKVTRKIKIDS